MPELLETKEFDGTVLPMETWARELIRKQTGAESEQVFHYVPVGEGDGLLALNPGEKTGAAVRPGQHVAAVLYFDPTTVSFVKAGAWMYGHNLAGYSPEADVHTFADWNDARDCFVVMTENYCSEADEANYDFAASKAERLLDQDDGQNDQVIVVNDTPSMYEACQKLMAATPPVPGKGYQLELPDHQGRVIVFWLTWDKTAVPDELLESER